jgi:hypothetical protein
LAADTTGTSWTTTAAWMPATAELTLALKETAVVLFTISERNYLLSKTCRIH